jgi:hypothetical protein
MYRSNLLATMLVSALIICTVSGCGGDNADTTSSNAGDATEGRSATAEAAHDHPDGGPHGGSLIELGNEEFHAELVHDDQTGTVTIYLLDSAAKASVPIAAADVSINVTHEGAGEQFKLTASADQNDPQGMSSRFVSSDAELAKELDHGHAEAQLAVTINGKPYRGRIAHNHGHDEGGHDHAGE